MVITVTYNIRRSTQIYSTTLKKGGQVLNTQKRIITAKEVARILGTSQMVIKELVRQGVLPGIVTKQGTKDRIIIPRAKFEEYLGERIEEKG